MPPSQVGSILTDCIATVGEYAKSIDKAEDFDVHLILDVHKLLAAELDGAYDLLSQPGFRETVWGSELPKQLAEAIRRNDMEAMKGYERVFCQQISVRESLSPITPALAWAVLVQSALLNERLVEDMKAVATEKGGCCLPNDTWLPFYGPCPPPEARQAFQQYVACRWPTHVFALDPVTQDENIGDVFSRRRESQLAIALAFASGKMSASSFTRYTRRLETDMATIALHRTAVGFARGANHFGWRFYPRYQTPPIESNLTVLARDLVLGGPTRDQDLKKSQIEPGMRECVALVIMPSFVSQVTLDTRSEWFCLTNPKHTAPSIKDTMRLSESIQRMETSVSTLRDSPRYRPGESDRLLRRVEQLSAALPLQTLHQQVPFENTLGGFAMFNSGMTDLAPQLFGHYGEPGIKLGAATTLTLVGNHFSVHETQVIAGNRRCEFQLLSRRVMRVTVPGDVQPITSKDKPDKPSVDIHVITPYGVSGHLHVPVVDGCPAAPNNKFTWGLPQVYNTSYTALASDKTKADVSKTNLLPTTNELIIEAPAGMLFPGQAKLSLTLAHEGKLIVTKDNIDITFDFQRNRFVLFGANFQGASTDLNSGLKNYLEGLKLPPNLNLTLTGRLVIAGNTFVAVDSTILIGLRQQ